MKVFFERRYKYSHISEMNITSIYPITDMTCDFCTKNLNQCLKSPDVEKMMKIQN